MFDCWQDLTKNPRWHGYDGGWGSDVEDIIGHRGGELLDKVSYERSDQLRSKGDEDHHDSVNVLRNVSNLTDISPSLTQVFAQPAVCVLISLAYIITKVSIISSINRPSLIRIYHIHFFHPLQPVIYHHLHLTRSCLSSSTSSNLIACCSAGLYTKNTKNIDFFLIHIITRPNNYWDKKERHT